MRQQRPTTLVLAISLALFANVALAQQATGGARAAGAASTGAAASAPAARGSSASNASNVSIGTSTNAAAQGNTAVQGNTSTTIANTSNGNQVTVGTPINGIQSSNTVNGTNPNPNATQGQTSGVTNGSTTGTSNGSTAGASDGSTSPGVVPSGVANVQRRLLDANGNLLVDQNGNALITDGRTVVGVAPVGSDYAGATIGVDPSQVVVAGADVAPVTGNTPTPELDRAARKELGKARVASRSNKQLLTTIAPRTNVDRTDQMADDPLPLRY